jgi:hypothetical protein
MASGKPFTALNSIEVNDFRKKRARCVGPRAAQMGLLWRRGQFCGKPLILK